MTVGAWKSWSQGLVTLDHSTIEGAEAMEPNQPLFITQDSRQFAYDPAAARAFVAITGLWHDGHDYLNEAYAEGARYFIVLKGTPVPKWTNADVVYSPDPVATWQSLARHWRDACDTSIIAIAGRQGRSQSSIRDR